MCLPTLAAEIAGNYPYRDVIRPGDFREFVRLAGNEVVNLSCVGGAPELAVAFLACGASSYVGAAGYPDGNASLMYALEYLYNRITGSPVAEAHRLASSHEDDRGQFRLFGQSQKLGPG